MKHIFKFANLNLLLVISLLMWSVATKAQTAWEVPADKAKIKNPVKSNAEIVAKGNEIYLKNCKSCHGDLGENNPIKLNPQPKDLSEKVVMEQTDGSLFYKITTGRGAMPTFNVTITENDRWAVINYLRSFKTGNASGPEGLKDFEIALKEDTTKHTITAVVSAKNDKGETVPVSGVETGLFVKRYFGDMQIGELKKTNDKGFARFDMPTDIPGDSTGNLNVYVMLTNKFYNGLNSQKTLKIGVPTIPKNILDGGHMWGNRLHAPWWIVMLYLGIAGGVWITIFYVLFLISKIKKAGKTVA